MIVLTIAEIKDLAEFCGLILTQESKDDKDQDETEVAVDDAPEGGLIDEDQARVLHHAHVAYFYEYPEEGSMPLGSELPTNCKNINQIIQDKFRKVTPNVDARLADSKNKLKQLHDLAEWFENPDKSPYCPTPVGSPCKILTIIAQELRMHIEQIEGNKEYYEHN